MERGFIKGKHAPYRYGRNWVYHFEHDDIIECIKQRPWLVKPTSMPPSYFRSIAREEWDKDPWYDGKEASSLLGLIDPHGGALHRYIKKGWIPTTRRPGAGGLGEYVIRKSAIDYFLKNDPRPLLYHAHRSEAARMPKRGRGTKRIHDFWCGFCRMRVVKPNSVHIRYKYWLFLCPRCGGKLMGDSPGVHRDIYKF